MHILSTNIQRARYERTVIDMANAYRGYRFYLPAFLDFRGRIYRSGIFHFHERDLARSLILFDESYTHSGYKPEDFPGVQETYITAGGFHGRSFTSNEDAHRYFYTELVELESFGSKDMECNELRPSVHECKNRDQALVMYSLGAKHPFQYMMFLWGPIQKCSLEYYYCVPITQDASASAYQIISYLLLDVTMAQKTNLIMGSPSGDGSPSEDSSKEEVGLIADVYVYIMKD